MSPYRSPDLALAAYVSDYLDRRGLSIRQAAHLAQIPPATLAALLKRPGGLPRRETLDGLARLGLDRRVVERLAAEQAGLDLLMIERTRLSGTEVDTALALRNLPKAERTLIERFIACLASPST